MRGHTVVIGYGTKGRSATSVLRTGGVKAESIVVIDSRSGGVQEATSDGFAAILGDSTRSVVLREAGVPDAGYVIVAVDRDDAAVLTTLTVRQLNADVPVAVAVREAENAPLARHSGANVVITSSEAAGRLLALSVQTPGVDEVVGDLLVRGTGLDLVDRPVEPSEVGRTPEECGKFVLGVVRDEHFIRYTESGPCREGDLLVMIRMAK